MRVSVGLGSAKAAGEVTWVRAAACWDAVQGKAARRRGRLAGGTWPEREPGRGSNGSDGLGAHRACRRWRCVRVGFGLGRQWVWVTGVRAGSEKGVRKAVRGGIWSGADGRGAGGI